jgi:hypothetical protein
MNDQPHAEALTLLVSIARRGRGRGQAAHFLLLSGDGFIVRDWGPDSGA